MASEAQRSPATQLASDASDGVKRRRLSESFSSHHGSADANDAQASPRDAPKVVLVIRAERHTFSVVDAHPLIVKQKHEVCARFKRPRFLLRGTHVGAPAC